MQQTDLSKAKARSMRQDMTPAERRLSYALRNRRVMGLKVRRQVPIGPNIADFSCADLRLIIEADGVGHGGDRDSARDQWLATRGVRVVRLRNSDILGAFAQSLALIAAAARAIDPSPPI